MLELNRLYNLDCMQGMKEFPDGFFDLAIVDPPYGIGIDGQRKRVCRNPKHNRKEHSREGWDNKPPTEEYFRELERVSREQIIWGGNYFVPMLKQAHKGWLVWDKGQRGLSMSDCELAYTSFDTPTRIFTLNRVELQIEGTIHPTQKPVKLYEWVLSLFARKGMKILDTHAGSASSLVACQRIGGLDYVGFEINTKYFEAANRRLEEEKAQIRLFDLLEEQEGKACYFSAFCFASQSLKKKNGFFCATASPNSYFAPLLSVQSGRKHTSAHSFSIAPAIRIYASHVKPSEGSNAGLTTIKPPSSSFFCAS